MHLIIIPSVKSRHLTVAPIQKPSSLKAILVLDLKLSLYITYILYRHSRYENIYAKQCTNTNLHNAKMCNVVRNLS